MIKIALLFLSFYAVSINSYSQEDSLQKPAQGVYFIKKHDRIKTTNYALFNSIRSIEKKDVGDTTYKINNYGEGWLDKDSVPVGYWRFYALENGEEYLFKEGNYERTSSRNFIYGRGNPDIAEKWHYTFEDIAQNYSELNTFIKRGDWKYYHLNGRLWKQINYQSSGIPLDYYLHEKNNGLQFSFKANLPNEDEWFEGKVAEYDDQGNLFKEVYYDWYNIAKGKRIYRLVKKVGDWRNPISATNY